MERKSIKTNGHDSLEDKSPTIEALKDGFDRRVDDALGQAVRFLDKLSSYARLAAYDANLAVNGKNVVKRTNSAVSANKHLQKLEQETADWFEVLQTNEIKQLSQVLEVASSLLDESIIGSGPTLQVGFDANCEEQRNLYLILNALCRFPGIGINFILIGLKYFS